MKKLLYVLVIVSITLLSGCWGKKGCDRPDSETTEQEFKSIFTEIQEEIDKNKTSSNGNDTTFYYTIIKN